MLLFRLNSDGTVKYVGEVTFVANPREELRREGATLIVMTKGSLPGSHIRVFDRQYVVVRPD